MICFSVAGKLTRQTLQLGALFAVGIVLARARHALDLLFEAAQLRLAAPGLDRHLLGRAESGLDQERVDHGKDERGGRGENQHALAKRHRVDPREDLLELGFQSGFPGP